MVFRAYYGGFQAHIRGEKRCHMSVETGVIIVILYDFKYDPGVAEQLSEQMLFSIINFFETLMFWIFQGVFLFL